MFSNSAHSSVKSDFCETLISAASDHQNNYVLEQELMAQLSGYIPVWEGEAGMFIRDRSLALRANEHDLSKNVIVSAVKELGFDPKELKYEYEYVAPNFASETVREIVKRRDATSALATGVLKNIEVFIPGTKPKSKTVVIGAHYDTQNSLGYFRNHKTTGYESTPGVEDNASGVVALFSLLKYFKKHPPKKNIRFLFFDAEEPGQINNLYEAKGSKLWLEGLSRKEKKSIEYALIIDMIGTSPNSDTKAMNVSVSSTRKAFYTDLLRARNVFHQLRVDFASPKSLNYLGTYSDSVSFLDKGVPIMLFSSTESAFGLPENYHSPDDTFHNLNWKHYMKSVNFLKTFIAHNLF